MEATNKPNKKNIDVSTIVASSNENHLSIFDRIEIGISKGLYVAPSELFLEKIKNMGFSNLKTFLIDFYNVVFNQLESKKADELAALNISDVASSSITENEVNDTATYEYQLGRMIIFEMAHDIRTIKANNASIESSDLKMSLNILQNLTDDLSFLKNEEIYKKEIAFLKAEIEKTSIFQTSEPINIEYFYGKINQFNKVPLAQVVKYFMQLADEPQSPFLNREDVFKFIDKAFCGNNKIEKLTFTNTKRNKGLIWKLFYNFFRDCIDDTTYESTKHKKEKYVSLVTSNFTNWPPETVFNNFSISNSKHWKKLNEYK